MHFTNHILLVWIFCSSVPFSLFGVRFAFSQSLNITYSNFSFIFMHTNSNQNNRMRKKNLMNNTRSVIIGLGIVFLCDVNIRSFLQFRIRLLACQPVCLFICLFYYCAWYKMCWDLFPWLIANTHAKIWRNCWKFLKFQLIFTRFSACSSVISLTVSLCQSRSLRSAVMKTDSWVVFNLRVFLKHQLRWNNKIPSQR